MQIYNKMTDQEIKVKIQQIQEIFGMSNVRLAEVLEMPLNTLKQKKYNEKFRFFPDDLTKLISFIKNEAIKL